MEKRYFWISILLAGLWSCNSEEARYLSTGTFELPGGEQVVLLYDTLAGEAIATDTVEGFFEQVPLADLQLQMKRPVRPEPRAELLEDYRYLLGNFVRPYTRSDMLKIRDALRRAHQLLQPLGDGLFPPELQIIKVQGHLYGRKVFYTRNNSIIVPAPALKELPEEGLMRILIHEIFHIYSRHHPEARKQLYGIVGFEPAGQPVLLPDSLQRYQLLNPDGIEWQQKIRLQRPGEPQQEVFFPIITARRTEESGQIPYYEHIGLSWHPADSTAAGWQVSAEAVAVEQLPGFLQQTGGNTDYILHPDEILADNLVLLATKTAPTTPAGERVQQELAAFFQFADNWK